MCLLSKRPKGEQMDSEAPESKRADHNATRKARVARGKCVLCGINPPRPDRVTCFACAIKQSDYNARNYARRKAAGMYQLPVGAQPKYRFSVIEGDREVFQGGINEVMDFLGCVHSTIYRAAGTPRIVQERYHIERIEINAD